MTVIQLVTPNDAVSEEQSINLSTTSPSTLFRVLPHFFMPGTLYSNRTASMLAVVALTGHIPHLLEPAKAFLSATRGTWLSTALPENFSTPFIRFMLSIPSSRSLIFSPEEHDVYSEMARYVHLEDQIDTKIQAKVPWTPMKSRGVGDRKRLCDGCGIRRSETMMHQVRSYVLGNMKAGKEEVEKEGDDGMRCGMCVDSDTKDPKDWKDQGEIRSCWVECSERWCRAQYVIEDEEGLRVRVLSPVLFYSNHTLNINSFYRYLPDVTIVASTSHPHGSNAHVAPIESFYPGLIVFSLGTRHRNSFAPRAKIPTTPDTRL